MGIDSLAQRTLRKLSFARWTCDFGPLLASLKSRWGVQKAGRPTMSLGMNACRPFTALVTWGRVHKDRPDGWLFRAPGFDPEPCPEGAWDLGPTLEVVPLVAAILAREAELPFVMVEHPGNPRMVYVYTVRGGGNWQKKITVLTGGLGATTAVKTLLEAKAA